MQQATAPEITQHTGTRVRIVTIAAFIALAIFGFLRIAATNNVDIDVWHQMALARELFRLGQLPATDSFAYTPTVPLIHHEWGAGVIAYFIVSHFGAAGLLIWKYLLGFTLAALCVTSARLRGSAAMAFAVCAFLQIYFIGLAFATVRAHIYSLIMIAAMLCFVRLDELGSRRWIPAWLLLVIVWMNVHAGIPVALGLLGVYFGESVVRKSPKWHLVPVIVATAALMIVNPYGWRYFPRMLHALTMPRPHMGEWLPIYRASTIDTVIFGITLIPLLYAIVSAGPRKLYGISVVMAALAGAVLHWRMLPFYAVVYCCYVPGFLQQTAAARRVETFIRREPAFVAGLWTCVALFFAVLLFFTHPLTAAIPQVGANGESRYPVQAVDYLGRTRFEGNLYVPFEFGAYISWKLYPHVRVSVDSRYEAVYPPRSIDENYDFYNAKPDWRETLDRYPTDAVLVPTDSPVSKLITGTGWQHIYSDPQYDIFTRRSDPARSPEVTTRPSPGGQLP